MIKYDDEEEEEVEASCTPQFYAALIASLGGFSLGTVFGWSTPAIPMIREDMNLDPTKISVIIGMFPVGGLCSMGVMAIMLDRVGCKIAMICAVLPFIAGWCALAFSNHVAALVTGRFVTGACAASFSVSVPIYIGEFAQKELRGTLGVFFQLLLVAGMLFSYLLSATHDIQYLSLLCCVPLILFLCLVLILPETPVFLLTKGRVEDASKSLQWFRGKKYNIAEELQYIMDFVEESREWMEDRADVFCDETSKMTVTMSASLMASQQLSGISIFIFYSSVMFKDSNLDVDPEFVPVILVTIQLIVTPVTAFTVDKVGRKALLILSHTGMGVALVPLGAYFFVKSRDEKSIENLGWLPLLSSCTHSFFYALGSGPLPWVVLGEIFPNPVKAILASICCGVHWALTIILTLKIVIDTFGLASMFWIFAAVSFLNVLVLNSYMKETKGKTLEHIQIIMRGGLQEGRGGIHL